jgi:hypothetical protein
MVIEKRLITPAIAALMLQKNEGNRRVRKDVVDKYANEMLNGRWMENTGETIKIAKDGTLVDGQHRLLALMQSGVQLNMHVCTDMDKEVFHKIDQGAVRNGGDIFQIAGIKSFNILPSIIQMQNNIKKGTLVSHRTGVDDRLTHSLLLEKYYQDPTFWDHVTTRASTWYSAFAKVLSPSVIGGIYSVALEINELQADLFMDQLCTGVTSSGPILLCRKNLIQDRLSARRVRPEVRIVWIVKAWNAFRSGSEPKQIKFDATRESFPTME